MNFKDIIGSVFKAGVYKVKVVSVTPKTSGTQAGSSDLVVKYEFLDGLYKGRIYTNTIYEKAFSFRLEPFLVAAKIDMNKEFNTTAELFAYGIKEAVNKEMMIEMTVRTYQGKELNDIAKWIPTASSTTSADEVANLFATEPTVEETKPVEAPKVETTAESAGDVSSDIFAGITDEDLPF